MTLPTPAPLDPADLVRAYHERSKHRYAAYAPGPEALDWEAQPAPFRHFAGADRLELPLLQNATPGGALALALGRPFGSAIPAPLPLELETLAALLQLSLGITAWKSYGPDRWAVRANPSSGNLHPAEAYVVAQGLEFLPDGVWHYRQEDHSLECRAAYAPMAGAPARLLLGLSSVMWREAWKYGERAFRYCQLDSGHALGALAYAADALGWRLAEQPQVGHASLARLLGLDRETDFPPSRRGDTEGEEPELLLSVAAPGTSPAPVSPGELLGRSATWFGQASQIDAQPVYRWPAISAVAAASRRMDREIAPAWALPPPEPAAPPLRPLGEVILGRRSAQRFDSTRVLSQQEFAGLLQALLPTDQAPWWAAAAPPQIDLLLYVQRVEGLTPGLYAFLRSADAAEFAAQLGSSFPLAPVDGMPTALRFLLALEAVPLKRLSRSLHCHQDLAASACFSVGMLARFEEVLADDPAAYRGLYREAGLIGQVLYLTAEARGLQGCGIGCYFDDPVHESAGLTDQRRQSLYHFAVGLAVPDPRIETSAPYPGRLSPQEKP